MSLLLLFAGAQAAGDDRTFTATWEQPAASWDAIAVVVGGPPAGVSVRGKRLRQPRVDRFTGSFEQPVATWSATAEYSDDEIVLALVLGLLDDG